MGHASEDLSRAEHHRRMAEPAPAAYSAIAGGIRSSTVITTVTIISSITTTITTGFSLN
ncbi:MAG TPA: hypothetical protein VKC60_12115 [Opitutaceae bacterium]|nr:hypothetical protein [Opitutaceae bacterium]